MDDLLEGLLGCVVNDDHQFQMVVDLAEKMALLLTFAVGRWMQAVGKA